MAILIEEWVTNIWNFLVQLFWHRGFWQTKKVQQDSRDTGQLVTSRATLSSDEDMYYPCTGKGLCIIITNFYGIVPKTAHLPGYIKDREDLQKLFGKEELDYDVIVEVDKNTPLLNLSIQEFRERLKDLQALVTKKCQEGKKYDRFLMFVLSHGGEQGLCTCGPGTQGTVKEYDADGNIVFMSLEEIINAFTHDHVPELAGVPKCYFFQACRGNSYVMSAANSDNEGMQEETQNEKVDLKKPTLKRENILVAYATLQHKYCFVESNRGSWFINTIVKEMQQICRREDILGIMTRVIQTISGKKDRKFFCCNDPQYEIRVLHKGNYLPLLIHGKLNKDLDTHEPDAPLCKMLPLKVRKNSYSSFAPSRHGNQDLSNYEFLGKIYYLKDKDCKDCSLDISPWIEADKLKTFKDMKYFEIKGKMKRKGAENTGTQDIGEGVVEILGNTFEIQHFEKPKGGLKPEEIDICGCICGTAVQLTESEMTDKDAQMYIEGHLYSMGKLEKHLGVWGMHADIYQLPVISSTLTRKMFLTPPLQQTEMRGCRDSSEERQAVETLMKCFGIKNQTMVKSNTTALSSKNEKDIPNRTLENMNVDTLQPAGADSLKKKRN